MGFAPAIRRVIAPAAGTGNLDLVDPDSRAVTAVGGFSASRGAYAGGHDFGVTSADMGRGLVFATDRTSQRLDVVDPAAGRIVASAKLAGGPDYVRWVEASARPEGERTQAAGPTGEVWVTEPDRESIEVFTVPAGPAPAPVHAATIAIKGGPESLVIDAGRRRAFTHLWHGATVAVDIASRALVATWPNGCEGSRGIALDARHGWLFAGCSEGKLVVLDVDHEGRKLGEASSGSRGRGPATTTGSRGRGPATTTWSGVDVIAYDATLAHAYVPGARSATMAVVGIDASGVPAVLGTVPTASGAHCVAADDRAQAWVCDPAHGRLLVYADPYAASGAAR